jgi:competence protein ComGC
MKKIFYKYKIIKTKKDSGFTLIEMLIYVFIFSLFIFALFSFSNIVTNSRIHDQIILEVNGQGSQAIQSITQTVRNAKSVNSPTASNSSAVLSLETYDSATNPTIFSVTSGGVLQVKEGTNPEIDLTNNRVKVSNLSFSNLAEIGQPGIIRISFKLSNLSESAISAKNYSADFIASGAIR